MPPDSITQIQEAYIRQVRDRLDTVHTETSTLVSVGQPAGAYPNGMPLGGVSLRQGALTSTERFPPGTALVASLNAATSTLTQRYTELQTHLSSAVDGLDDLIEAADATESLNEMTVERFRGYVPNVYHPVTPPPPVPDEA